MNFAAQEGDFHCQKNSLDHTYPFLRFVDCPQLNCLDAGVDLHHVQ